MESRKVLVISTLIIILLPLASLHMLSNASAREISDPRITHESYYYSSVKSSSTLTYLIENTVNSSTYIQNITFSREHILKQVYINITSIRDGGFILNTTIPYLFKVGYNPDGFCFTIWTGKISNVDVMYFDMPLTGILRLFYVSPDGVQSISINLTNIKFGEVYFRQISMVYYLSNISSLVSSHLHLTSLTVEYNSTTLILPEQGEHFKLCPNLIGEGDSFAPSVGVHTGNLFFAEIFGLNGKLAMVSFLYSSGGGTYEAGIMKDENLYPSQGAFSFNFNSSLAILVLTSDGVESNLPLNLSVSFPDYSVVKIGNTSFLIYLNGTYSSTKVFPLSEGNYSFVINQDGVFNVKEYISPHNGVGYVEGDVILYYQNMTQIRDIYHQNNMTFVYVSKGEIVIEKASYSSLLSLLTQNVVFLVISLVVGIVITVVAFVSSKS